MSKISADDVNLIINQCLCGTSIDLHKLAQKCCDWQEIQCANEFIKKFAIENHKVTSSEVFKDCCDSDSLKIAKEKAIKAERNACAELIDKIGYSHTSGMNQYISSEFARAANLIRNRATGENDAKFKRGS